MAEFLLLPRDSDNGRYASDLPRLTAAEAAFVLDAADTAAVAEPEPVELAGVTYVVLRGDLDDATRRVVASLAGTRALFERRDDALVPVELPTAECFPRDLVTIQRYVGKTNEAFTRLLLNVTASAAGIPVRRVLDPLAGRGTTLHHAVLLGIDAYGIEGDKKAVEAHRTFFIQWLKDHRIKHKATTAGFTGDHASGSRTTVAFGPEREHLVEITHADTRDVGALHRDASFDAIVTDLPYGVQHGSRTDRRERGPAGLLRAALPQWRRVLKQRGSLGMSFNTRTLPVDEMCDLLGGAGFTPVHAPEGVDFIHDVDRSITRDLVVARPTL